MSKNLFFAQKMTKLWPCQISQNKITPCIYLLYKTKLFSTEIYFSPFWRNFWELNLTHGIICVTKFYIFSNFFLIDYPKNNFMTQIYHFMINILKINKEFYLIKKINNIYFFITIRKYWKRLKKTFFSTSFSLAMIGGVQRTVLIGKKHALASHILSSN